MSHWNNKRVEEVCTIIAGQSPDSKYYNQDGAGIPFFQGKADFGSLYPTIRIYCSQPHKIAEKGDILLSVRAPVGPTNLAPCRVCIGRGLTAIRPNEELLTKFVLLFFRYYEAQLEQQGGGTTFKAITQATVKSIKIPVPSLDEQERIVAKIEELFSEIDKIEETILRTSKQLIQYKQAILKYAFSTIEHGKPSTLGEVLQNKPRNGFSPKAVAHETPYKNLTLTSTTGGVFRDGFYKYIELDIDKDSYLWVKRNDILIQRANTIDYVGTAALYTGEDNQYVYPDLMMKCRTKAGILPSFIVYQLQSQNCKIHFRKHATGTSGSMPKINQQTVISTPIVIADIHIQEKVVQHIEQQLSACTNIELTIQRTQEQLKSLRRSILKQAFEGNLV